MAALDMDRLPSGVQGWRTLVEELLAVGDDRHEGHHLELKSEVDMSTKAGRAKIAKFILATANRAPEFAASRFGGSAVMLVGLDYSSTPPGIAGAAAFDDKDLRREVTRFIGDPGPGWDYVRVDVDGTEVVAIIVEPPEHAAVWPCQRDGDGIRDGLIYLRQSAESRPATGPEVASMIERVRQAQPAVDIEVELVGHVYAVSFDRAAAVEHIRDAAGELRMTCPSPPASATRGIGFAPGALPGALSGFAGRTDSRSRAQFHAEVDRYEAAAIAALDDVHDAIMAAVPGIAVRVTNKTTLDLHDVEVVIHLDPPYEVIDHHDEIPSGLLPERPREWGPDPITIPGLTRPIDMSAFTPGAPGSGYFDVTDRDDGGVDLVVNIGHLRPRRAVTTPDDEYVLTVPVEHTATAMTARWSMTATGIHEQFTGDVEPVSTANQDLSEVMARCVATEIARGRRR